MCIPKGAALVKGWRVFEARHLLEEIHYIIMEYQKNNNLLDDTTNQPCNFGK